MAGAMPLANLIWQSLTQAGDAAFHWWVALSPAIGCDPVADPEAPARSNDRGWNDGLVYYDPRYAENGNQRLYLTKRYWVLGNFSRHVRPGAVVHRVNDLPAHLRALAFRSERGWVVVCINNAVQGAGPSRLSVQLPDMPNTTLAVEAAVETSAGRDLRPVAEPDLVDAMLILTLPAWSVTTVTVAARPAGSGRAELRVRAPGSRTRTATGVGSTRRP